MMQFSVYVRISKNYALLERHINRIEKHTPKEGSVKTIIINKEQYDNIKELVKTNSHFINIDKNYKNSSKIIYLQFIILILLFLFIYCILICT